MKKNRRKSSQEQAKSSSPEPSPSPAVPPPPLEWEDQAQCLGPILRYNSLPLVVTCDRSCLPPMEHVNFDFTQPLLLHTRRTVRKVVAANVVHVQHESVSRLKEVGDRLLIPEDYKGWFAVLGPPDEVKPDKVVPHFRQVAQLALSKCESFLVGGNEPVTAVQMPSAGSGGDNRAQPRLVYPGDVLRMGKLYVGESTVKKPKLFGGKKTVKKEEKFLLCTDDNDRDLYLPVENRGTFYMLTTEGHGTPRIPIMRMPDICTHFRFPCVVKLLFGRVPSTPCSFTGTLVLRDSQIESSVIGCTMLNLRNILLDIPIDSDLKFFIAKSMMDLLASRAYKNAKALCQDKVNTYMRNMKVAYYVNDEEGDAFKDAQQEMGRQDSEISNVSENAENFSISSRSSALARSRPSIVEDHDLFCPPETTPKSPVMSSSLKKSKKSIPTTETTPSGDSVTFSSHSPTVLRKDRTFSLPEPAEVLPLTVSKSLPLPSVENRPLPPIVAPVQTSGTLPSDHYMSMDEAVDKWSVSNGAKPTPLDSKTPPPTPPKPRKRSPLAHSQSDASLYTQVWNGEARTSPAVESVQENPDGKSATPVLRPKRLNIPVNAQRVSGIALADTYLTLPVFKRGSVNTGADNKAAFSTTVKVNQQTRSQSEEVIYKIPSSMPRSSQSSQTSSSVADQPYETMTSVTRPRHDSDKQDSFNNQNPPSLPPKTRRRSSNSVSTDVNVSKPKPLLPLPSTDADTDFHGIMFENASWMFSDTSSSGMQSCEYASRWLSGHHEQPSQDGSDPVYVHMQRESFDYYEGYDPSNQSVPKYENSAINRAVTETKDSSFDQSADQSISGHTSSIEESEAVYENIQNLRLCKETLSSSNSFSDPSEDNHARFLDKLANPATMFGYIRAPPPRPVTPKKPPIAKKTTIEKNVSRGESFDSGSGEESESRLPLPPTPCKASESEALGYLHPCADRDSTNTNTVGYVCVLDDSGSLPSLAQSRITSCYSDVSQQSSEDDLPLGATFANFRSRMSDSGCALESVAESGDVIGKGTSGVSSLSVADLGDALKNVGLMKETVETLRKEKVDGRLLVSLDEEELKETLPGVKKLDIKKIRMFVNGWRPME